MDRMIERVARAILAGHDWTEGSHHFDEQGNGVPGPVGWDALAPSWQEAYRSMARAAINEMREPTQAMLDESGLPLQIVAREVWGSMLNAALSEPPLIQTPTVLESVIARMTSEELSRPDGVFPLTAEEARNLHKTAPLSEQTEVAQ